MRSERWREVDRENLQGLRTAGTAQAMCGDGTCKKQYFEGNAEIFDSPRGLSISHCRQNIHALTFHQLTSSTRDIRDVISSQQPQFMGHL